MAHCELRRLRQYPVVPLRGLDALPQHSLPAAEASSQGLRPFRHLSAHRRDLHTILAGQYARRLGLVSVRGNLGTRDGGDSLQGLVRGAFVGPVHGGVPADGLARASCDQADASRGSAQRTHLVTGRRSAIHSGRRVLRVEERPIQPRNLAWLRHSRKHLPLFCGALLGNPAGESLIKIPIAS